MNTLDLFLKYLQPYNTPTQRSYMKQVVPFVKWCTTMNITPQTLQLHHMQGYLYNLLENDAAKYIINFTITTLKHYGHMLVKEKLANEKFAMELYIFSLQLESHETLLTTEEINQIYDSFQTPGLAGFRNKVIISLLISQALTIGEIIHLEVEHIDITNKIVKVPQTYYGKARELALTTEQIPLFKRYIENTRVRLLIIANTESSFLFISTSDLQSGINITDCLRATIKRKNKTFSSYTQLRNSILYNWYHEYGLQKVIELAGHEYVGVHKNK